MKYLTNSKILILAVFMTVLFSLNVSAVNLTPEARMKLKEAGALDSYIELLKDAEIRGLNLPSEIKRSTGLAADVETTDTITILVLLVDFSDNPESGDAVSGVTAAAFDSTLFSYGINPTGSMTEYYLENSFGTMLVRGQVHGWYRMPQLYSYYHDYQAGVGTWPNNSQGLTWDAIQTADAAGLDFSQFDTYGPDGDIDGYIDGLLIVHSGPGFETSLDTTDIQSHKWSLGDYYQYVDYITIDDFTMQAEEFGGDQSPIGVFCHEFGHILGLPDLYDVDYVPSTSDGIGIWSLMGTGSYKNSGRVPSHLDAWSKAYLGFAVPTVVNSNMVDVELPQIESEPVIYKMYAGGYPNEYFLVENRQRVGFDEGLPGTGLLIYHVDEATTYNNVNVENYHVAVEQADGLMQLEYGNNNEGDSGDPWPGLADKRSFDDLSTPGSRVYNGDTTEVSVWNISDSDSLMTANLDVSWSRPNFDLINYVFEDPNENGFLEPGELIEFYFNMRNDWLTANNVTISMSCNDPSITFEDSTVFKSAMIGDGEVAHNFTDPITFFIPSPVISTFDSFFVSVESDAGQFTAEFAIEQQVGISQILIVDDDRGGDYESLYIGDLYKNLIPADIWSKQTTGSPSAVVLNNYNTVIWFTGDTSNTLLNSSDVSAMKSFLDNGGNLFLTGQGIAGELHDEDSTFLEDYLHARYGGLAFYPFQTGISGSPISDGFNLIRYFSSSNQEYTKAEYIIPVGEAIPAFAYQFYGNVTSLSYSGSNKVVFFDFGYEGIDNISSSKYASRDSVFARVLNFFGQVPTDVSDVDNNRLLPKSFVLAPNYPNPFNPMTTISYTVRNNGGGASKITLLKIYNVLGQDIKTLVDEIQIPGHYSVEWDGTDNAGNHVGSGMYFYRLTRGNDAESRKMVFLK